MRRAVGLMYKPNYMKISRLYFMVSKDSLSNKYLSLTNISYWLVLKEIIKVLVSQTIKYFTMLIFEFFRKFSPNIT